MKRKLSSQAIKAMAIGMAFSVTSTTIASGVNVYADSLTNEETTQNNGVSVLPVFPSEEVTEDTPVVLPELPQADTPVVLPSFPSEDTDSIPATPIETVDTLEVAETGVYENVAAVNVAISQATDESKSITIDVSKITDINATINIVDGANVILTGSITDESKLNNVTTLVEMQGNTKATTLTLKDLNIKANKANIKLIDVKGKNAAITKQADIKNTITLEGTNTFNYTNEITPTVNTTASGSSSAQETLTDSATVINVDYNNTDKYGLILNGNGTININNFAVGIGSSTAFATTDVVEDTFSKDNLVIESGNINMTNIHYMGIGYRIGYTIQNSCYANGLISGGNINISTGETGLGVSIHEMTGGTVNITNNFGYKGYNNSIKKITTKPGFAADTISGGTLTVTTTKDGVLGGTAGSSPTTGAHIVNVNGGDITINIDANYSDGILTSSMSKGNVKVNVNGSKVSTFDNASGTDGVRGIVIHFNPKVWKGDGNFVYPQNLGIVPKKLGDLNVSITTSDNFDKNLTDIVCHYVAASTYMESKAASEVITQISRVTYTNYLVLDFANNLESGYNNLTVNENKTGFNENITTNTRYYVFGLENGDVTANVSKENNIYNVLNDGKTILGTVEYPDTVAETAQQDVPKTPTDNTKNELKVTGATVAAHAQEENIIATNANGTYTFEIIPNTKNVKLVNFTNSSSKINATNFEKGIVTVNSDTYTLTEIGNGSTTLSNISDAALAGHTDNVTKVNDNAFTNNKNITNVSLPKATSIGANSFKGTGIQQANYPEVTYVGNNAFDSTPNLSNVTLPKVENVGDNAFANSSLVNADLGSKVPNDKPINIPNNAFTGSSNLNTIQTNSNSTSQSGATGSAQNSGSNNVVIKDETGNTTGTVNNNGGNSGGSSGSTGGSSGGGGANIGTTNTNNNSTENNTNTNTENNNNNNNSTVVEDKTLGLDVISLPSVTGEPKAFADVASNHWAKAHIDKLSTAGIISGDQNGNFNLNGQTKRADVTIMLVKLLGLTPETNTKFNDVDSNAYYAAYVGAASNYGIVNGSNGNFNPNGIISRQDTMVMIAQILKGLNLNVNTDTSNLTQFSDVSKISPYANESVAILVNSGIITGNNGKLNPTAPVTRAEMATIMSKLYDVLASAK